MDSLASSEVRLHLGGAGLRAHEAVSINLSLTTLGMCINARADPNSTHIPFRDSKLTRLLQVSLPYVCNHDTSNTRTTNASACKMLGVLELNKIAQKNKILGVHIFCKGIIIFLLTHPQLKTFTAFLRTARATRNWQDSQECVMLHQESLGGNAKTSLVIAVANALQHVDETLQSLQFGSRAMRVHTQASPTTKALAGTI